MIADLVVVGAGIGGLVIAHDAARAGLDVVVLEEGGRTGGMLRRADLGGVSIDIGAESFATRTTGVADLIADAGLDLRIVSPTGGGAHLAAVGDDGVLRAPLPRRTVLGIPADPLAADVVRILGEAGARRAAAEAEMPLPAAMRSEPDAEPTLAALVAERFGPVLLERLVDPLCRSVYSVPAAEVRLSRLHPALWRAFGELGSLTAAAASLAAPERAGGAVAGIEGGMWRLAAELHRAAVTLGADVRTGARVREISAEPGGVVVIADGVTLRARRVVVATGTAAARILLGAPAAPPPVVRVAAALVRSTALDDGPVGSGVIAAAEVPAQAKALTHVTSKWEWAARAVPPGHHVVRFSARDASSRLGSPADVAREVALLAGVPLAPADVVAVVEETWPDAVASPPVDPARRAALEADGVLLAGAAVAGTGLASVVPHARDLARRIVAERGDAAEPGDAAAVTAPADAAAVTAPAAAVSRATNDAETTNTSQTTTNRRTA